MCSIMKSSRKERPTFVTLGFSSNVITGRVSPVRLRRNRKQCSSEEICSRATLCICPFVNDGRVSLSMPSNGQDFR